MLKKSLKYLKHTISNISLSEAKHFSSSSSHFIPYFVMCQISDIETNETIIKEPLNRLVNDLESIQNKMNSISASRLNKMGTEENVWNN